MRKKIVRTNNFQKHYIRCKKLFPSFIYDFKESINSFLIDRNLVYDHALTKRDLKDLRAFRVTEDIRVVYQETKDSFIFILVGEHKTVY